MIDIRLQEGSTPIKAQEVTNLLLIPSTTDGGKNPVALEEVHTKDVHLIVVSEDLTFFSHEHPKR